MLSQVKVGSISNKAQHILLKILDKIIVQNIKFTSGGVIFVKLQLRSNLMILSVFYLRVCLT